MKTEAVNVSFGTQGFEASTVYSGFDYSKFVTLDGNLVIGSLPDDDNPDLSKLENHHHNGRDWKLTTLADFCKDHYYTNPD